MATISIFGTLGKDPVIDGTEKAQFSVCENQYQGPAKDKKPIWYNCQWWGKRGANMASNFQKGQQCYVTGELSFYTTAEGKEMPCINVTEARTAFSSDKPAQPKQEKPQQQKTEVPFDDEVPF
jgi:single-stranded DNA-binding protein